MLRRFTTAVGAVPRHTKVWTSATSFTILRPLRPFHPAAVPKAPATFQRRQASRTTPSDEQEEEFSSFDPTASLAADVRKERQSKAIESLVATLLPPDAPSAARAKLIQHFTKTPINEAVIADQVQITHVLNDQGHEVKAGWRMSRDEALQKAEEVGMDLTQLATGETETGVPLAYCRLRRERDAALALVEDLLEDAGGNQAEGKKPKQQAAFEVGSVITVEFSDVVDRHFINWRSDRVLADLRKGHPVKLSIKRFQSPFTAVSKLREFVKEVESKCARNPEASVPHHATNLNAAERELTVTLAPLDPAKGSRVRHPADKEWERLQERLESLRDGAHKGTYVRKVGKLRGNNGQVLIANRETGEFERIKRNEYGRRLIESEDAMPFKGGS